MSEKNPVLKLNKLKKHFHIKKGVYLKAVEDVSLTIYEGEKLAIVGESGCGKSTLGRVILQLYDQTSGSCVYYGKSLEEVAPAYYEKEVALLPTYQAKAKEFYKKSEELLAKAKTLQTQLDTLTDEGTNRELAQHTKLSKQIAILENQAKEHRKDASRQLREGSRAVGSMILSPYLAEIQTICRDAYKSRMNARKENQAYNKILALLEAAQLGNATVAEAEQLKKDLAETAKRRDDFRNENHIHHQNIKAYHNKEYQMITELCDDPVYLAKLDNNLETGINLGKLTPAEMRSLRRDMQMIFQDPAASLDSRQSVGSAIEEVFEIHTSYTAEERRACAMELLVRVGLKEDHYYSYPHMLSGGQKQRVGIARAIALNPKFLVLDESVSALDVSVQAQILQLLEDLRVKYDLTYFFITHNLGVVKHFCDRVMVMYLGNVFEVADCTTLFSDPRHPYTKSLLSAVPRPTVRENEDLGDVLEGEVPSPLNPPPGCLLSTRCPHCMDICKVEKPLLREIGPNHTVACHLYDTDGGAL